MDATNPFVAMAEVVGIVGGAMAITAIALCGVKAIITLLNKLKFIE